ncbi:hypothetical protein AB4283_23950, partial [Vibrio splendidus]
MYVTIALAAFTVISLILLIRSRSSLKELQLQDEDIEKVYAPVTQREQQLSDIAKNYQALQESYKKELLLLKEGEKQLSHYYLSVGTTDSISYTNLS